MSDAKTVQNQIKELKVSGHMMALDPGLYCIFNAPGGPVSAADTGLPGVRITAAPSMNAGQVVIAGFAADGWVGSDSGALVRVTAAAAEILVTVYQAPGTTADAPKLQVVRLSPDAAAPAAAPPSRAQNVAQASRERAAAENVEVVAHIYGRGDVGEALGSWMGEPGSKRWIEGFAIAPIDGVPVTDIEYQAVLGRGWLSPWSEGGQFCGSRGMALPILGLRVRLRGGSAQNSRIVLSATFVDGTQIGPVGDGDACEAPSLAALESFQIKIEAIGGAAVKGKPAVAAKPVKAAAKPAKGKAPAGKITAAATKAPAPKRAKALVEAPITAPAKPRRR